MSEKPRGSRGKVKVTTLLEFRGYRILRDSHGYRVAYPKPKQNFPAFFGTIEGSLSHLYDITLKNPDHTLASLIKVVKKQRREIKALVSAQEE